MSRRSRSDFNIKSKEQASLLIATTAAVAAFLVCMIANSKLWIVIMLCVLLFVVIALISLFLIKSYVAYKLKPIYSIVFSRDVKSSEISNELEEKSLAQVSEEIAQWADTSDKEIAKLKETERFRKQYLGNVAHELKTPIFNVQGYITTLLDGGLEDDGINRDYLMRAERSIERLINIVNDLGTISKLESNMTHLRIETFDIVALAREVAEQAEPEAAKRKIRIVMKSVDATNPYFVEGDKHYIGQVVLNLLTNSIRYGRDGGVTRVEFSDMIDKVLVEVSDDGIGIAKGDIPRIFERFYRADKGRSRERGGSGLGLAIVKHIIEAHSQKVTVRSEVGRGSTFSFTLKRVE